MPFSGSIALWPLAGVGVYVTAVWLLSLWKRDSGIMDVFWGPGFLLAAGLAAVQGAAPSARLLLVMGLLALWALRLAWHIGRRNAGKPEDARYARWRAQRPGSWWWFSWFKVFALQGSIMWLVSFPLFAILTSSAPERLTALDWAGAVIFFIGWAIESVADRQLTIFKSRKSREAAVLDTGLWRYTRHPNYFGESVIWLGVAIWALNIPGGWMTLFGPILMIWLIVQVSGVRMLDALLAETKPGYAAYMRRTSAFIPMPPTRNESDAGEFAP